MPEHRDGTALTFADDRRGDGYLTAWRHVDDLLEAAEHLLKVAGNTAALFDARLERAADEARRFTEDARAAALHGYQEAHRV